MIQLTLYTTSGCHLCEEAEKMLKLLQSQQVCQWVAVDISEEDCLVDRYGLQIPVVASEKGRELGWPFTLEELNGWLERPVSG